MDGSVKRKVFLLPTMFLTAVFVSGCSFGIDASGIVSPDHLVSENETYEKQAQGSQAYSFEDRDSLYEEDDTQVVTMYLTVGQGNESEGTNHTWTEVNRYSLDYYEEQKTEPYKCEAVLQVGDEAGPVKDEFGYGVTAANATVQLRGSGASTQPQKSFRIKIKDGKGKWNGQKVIILNKHITDPLRFTDRLAYSLMEDIPYMVSVRTRFVHLYVKDRTEGENGLFCDYGLFTQAEQINKTYLKNHGFDKDGQLYQAKDFDWMRHEDSIRLATDADFDKNLFEQYLEIEGSDDHEKLIELLEAVNNDTMAANEIVSRYFDEDNLYYWLAFHMLTGDKETGKENYCLYSPQMFDTWYFISRNNAGAFSEIEERLRDSGYDPSWNTGIFTYTDGKLFERIFQDQRCREEFDEAVEDLYRNYLTEEKIGPKAEALGETARKYVYQMPDRMYARVTEETYDRILESLIDEVKRNYRLYKESLSQPWPFHIQKPGQDGGKLVLRWEEAYLYHNPDEEPERTVSYEVELSRTPDFKDCIETVQKVEGTSFETTMLPAGQYFVRVRARTGDGASQNARECYRTEQGTTVYSTQCFYVQQDGSIEVSVYDEEE